MNPTLDQPAASVPIPTRGRSFFPENPDTIEPYLNQAITTYNTSIPSPREPVSLFNSLLLPPSNLTTLHLTTNPPPRQPDQQHPPLPRLLQPPSHGPLSHHPLPLRPPRRIQHPSPTSTPIPRP